MTDGKIDDAKETIKKIECNSTAVLQETAETKLRKKLSQTKMEKLVNKVFNMSTHLVGVPTAHQWQTEKIVVDKEKLAFKNKQTGQVKLD